MHKYIYWPTFGRTHEAICRARFAPVNSTNKKLTAEEVVSGHPIRDTLDDNSTWRSQPKKNTKKMQKPLKCVSLSISWGHSRDTSNVVEGVILNSHLSWWKNTIISYYLSWFFELMEIRTKSFARIPHIKQYWWR